MLIKLKTKFNLFSANYNLGKLAGEANSEKRLRPEVLGHSEAVGGRNGRDEKDVRRAKQGQER